MVYALAERELGANVLSLDDFYLTRNERLTLASQYHPLLSTRGVPGTHDMVMMNKVIDDLAAGSVSNCPRFNKAEDDRYPGVEQVEAADRLICEGWCWGASPQTPAQLQDPINLLERSEDTDGSWRQHVNDQLAGDDYQRAFANDFLIFLSVPSMDSIHRWRLQQERGLPAGSQSMNRDAIGRFIQFYERITRHMLSEMPGRADVTIYLSENHKIDSINLK